MELDKDSPTPSEVDYEEWERMSYANTSYDNFSLRAPTTIAKNRGLGTEFRIIIRALLDQDRRHAQSPFQFMSLPGEIRNRIYAAAAGLGSTIDPSRMKVSGLIAISSQTRKECLSLFLGGNTFQLLDRRNASHRATFVLRGETYKRLGMEPYFYRFKMRTRELDPHAELVRKLCISHEVVIEDGTHVPLVLLLERDVTRTPEYSVHVSCESKTNITREEIDAAEHIQRHVQRYIDNGNEPFTFSARILHEIVYRLPVKLAFNKAFVDNRSAVISE